MRILTADPGKAHVGWALFYNGGLSLCGLLRFDGFEYADLQKESGCPDAVIIERPKVYPQRRQKGDPNDLIDIAFTGGSIAAHVKHACGFANIHTVTPRDWKGTVPKEISHSRITKSLLASEQDYEIYSKYTTGIPKSLQHNVMDAIGMGYWACDQGDERWQTKS